MHMPDALITPAVAVPAIAIAGGAVAWSCRRASSKADDRAVPLMGVIGAFVFAAQMINIPVVVLPGVSWHVLGAVLMAVLLGPHAALVLMAAILTVQALLLGDGGLLALGCNVVNMGVICCYLGYGVFSAAASLIDGPRGRAAGIVLACVVSSTAAAVAAAVEVHLSGTNPVTLWTAALAMGSVHFVFGIGEALMTVAAVAFIERVRPAVLPVHTQAEKAAVRRFALGSLALSLAIGGVVSFWASSLPDGLEHVMDKFGWPEAGGAFGGLLAPIGRAAESAPFIGNAIVGLAATAAAFGIVLAAGAAISRRPKLGRPGQPLDV